MRRTSGKWEDAYSESKTGCRMLPEQRRREEIAEGATRLVYEAHGRASNLTCLAEDREDTSALMSTPRLFGEVQIVGDEGVDGQDAAFELDEKVCLRLRTAIPCLLKQHLRVS